MIVAVDLPAVNCDWLGSGKKIERLGRRSRRLLPRLRGRGISLRCNRRGVRVVASRSGWPRRQKLWRLVVWVRGVGILLGSQAIIIRV